MTEARSTILVVEDEAPIRDGLRDCLRRAGYLVATASSIDAASPKLATADLVVLDRRLPDGDGLQILRQLREGGGQTPVVVLSAMGETEQRIAGLLDGADDYLTKPFDVRELLARVQAVLTRASRGQQREGAELSFGECTLDVGARTLRRGRQQVELSRMEFKLLLYLRRHAGRALERSELLDSVWGYDHFPTTRTVDFHVLSLRKKIEPRPEAPRHIITVHRVGYRFEL